IAVEYKNAEIRICCEFGDSDGLTSEYPLRVRRRVAPASKPYDFGRRTERGCQFIEIGIGAYDDELCLLSKSPDVAVRLVQQVEISQVRAARVQCCKPYNEFAGEIFVKQELHRATRRPMRAANS